MVLLLVFIITSAFNIQKKEDPVKTEKKARVKMIKNVDGVVTEIDTVLVNFEPGDIEGISEIFMKSYSEKIGNDSLKHSFTFDFDGSGKKKHICKIITSDDLEETMDFDVSSICKGDSIIKKIIVTTDDKGNCCDKKVIIMKGDSDGDNELMDVSVLGTPRVKMIKMNKDENVIRLDDPSIVSFKKKDLGGNKEKIEIIREK